MLPNADQVIGPVFVGFSALRAGGVVGGFFVVAGLTGPILPGRDKEVTGNMALPSMLANGTCPFIDQGDGRCSGRMTKQALAEAFDFCLGGRHHACHAYHTISWELRAQADDLTTDLQHGAPARDPGPATAEPRVRPAAGQSVVLTLAGRPVPLDPAPQALAVRGAG